ncbi:secondary thiamine-phosphate synthase enzyme YjbQ [Natronospira bacteriovora]|uniref:Secondary thiamine-phosphate synthase enzyme YjbQ n=1 Tax=Natronospira bacteriovora TaxID=3069753 RepID=A0ABU0W4F4_9GAMM|nr:secondary thiamine-phosphate synthase enzyme YjbQ [Natronospira sp. AB-CW4]MDQ2068904.1 secondary thiamine-phosphate synthase enzyme YjbQ [Natronospira sp. AB-CW4]
MFRKQLALEFSGREMRDITRLLNDLVSQSGVQQGLCHLLCLHTSASLLICENADPDVPADMERFLARLVPDGDPLFVHDAEGPDDMPAHVRSMLTQPAMTLPVEAGRLLLGTWQGVFLCEHRTCPQRRRVVVTIC